MNAEFIPEIHTVAEDAAAIGDARKNEKAERGRSRIEWPYFSLEEAYKLAKGTAELGGTCQIDQLAGHLTQTATGGAFRLKVQAARTFGLLSSTQGNISLTDLGSQILEPETEREARSAAFLKVPLYAAIYEQYKGRTLPPPVGLEGAMVLLGVAVKQKDKARQAFQRSAKEAGFFNYGTTKLVPPVVTPEKVVREQKLISPEVPSQSVSYQQASAGNGGGGGGNGGRLHPFIQGLLEELPAPKSEWPLDGRRKWLQSALGIFDLIYEGAGSGQGLTVKLDHSGSN